MTNQVTLLPFLELLEEELIEFKNLIEFSALLLGHKEVIRLVLNPQSIARLHLFTNQYFPYFLIKISSAWSIFKTLQKFTTINPLL